MNRLLLPAGITDRLAALDAKLTPMDSWEWFPLTRLALTQFLGIPKDANPPFPDLPDRRELRFAEEDLSLCRECGALESCLIGSNGSITLPISINEKTRALQWERQSHKCHYRREHEGLVYHRATVEKTGIGEKYATSALDALESHPGIRDAIDRARRYCTNKEWEGGAGLAFCGGDPGTGKTELGAAIILEAIKARIGGFPLRFQMKDILPRDDGTGTMIGQAEYDRARKEKLVLLDDVGTEPANGYARDRLESLIEARYSAKLATIITSNLTPTELQAHLGPRLWSRLRDAAGKGRVCEMIRVSGPDYREKRGRQQRKAVT